MLEFIKKQLPLRSTRRDNVSMRNFGYTYYTYFYFYFSTK